MKKSKTPSAGEYGEKQELTQTDGGSSASCSNYFEGLLLYLGGVEMCRYGHDPTIPFPDLEKCSQPCTRSCVHHRTDCNSSTLGTDPNAVGSGMNGSELCV